MPPIVASERVPATTPPRRPRGAVPALGAVWRRDDAPQGAEGWTPYWRPGDRVVDLPDAEGNLAYRAILFGAARRVPVGGQGDVIIGADPGLSMVLTETPVPAGVIELADAGRRWWVRPAATPSASEVLGLSELPVWRSRAVGEARPEAPAHFGLVRSRLGLGAPEAAGSPDGPSGSTRFGAWLRRLGAELLGLVLPHANPRLSTSGLAVPSRARRTWEWLGRIAGRALRGLGEVLLLPAVLLGAGFAVLLGGPILLVGAALGLAGRLGELWAAARAWVGTQILRRFPAWADWSPLVSARLWLSWAHARALQELIRRFRGLDLLEALRWAVPLGGDGSAAPEGWFFSKLRPREGWSLAAGAAKARQRAEAEVISLLRRLYLDAHARLDAEGDVERAAWVLAELLRDPAHAVRYLEARGEGERAAEWAEILELPTETALGLWVRLGQPDRAIALALRRGAVAATLTALGNAAPAETLRLRRAFAGALWAADARRAAMTTLWPLRDTDPDQLRAWAGRCLDEGGPNERWALAVALSLDPPQDPELAISRALPTAAPAPEDAARVARRSIAAGILAFGPADLSSVAAMVRALLHDMPAAGAAGARTATLVQDLAGLLPSGTHTLLRADLPVLSPRSVRRNSPGPAQRGATLTLAPEIGSGVRPFDVGRTDDGAVVAALGELGVWIHRPGGAPRVWPVPAHRVIAGEECVLVVANEGPATCRITRISPYGPPRSLGCLPACPVTETEDRDGLLWISCGERIEAWRPGASGLDRVWSSGVVGRVLDMKVSGPNLFAVIDGIGQAELWHWHRAVGPTLRARTPVPGAGGLPVKLAPGGGVFYAEGAGARWFYERTARPVPVIPGTILGFRAGALVRWLPGPKPRIMLTWYEPATVRSPPELFVEVPGMEGQTNLPIVVAGPDGLLLIGEPSGVVRLIDPQGPRELDRWRIGG